MNTNSERASEYGEWEMRTKSAIETRLVGQKDDMSRASDSHDKAYEQGFTNALQWVLGDTGCDYDEEWLKEQEERGIYSEAIQNDAEQRTCDSCRKSFLSQEYLNKEKLCADCQALIQETFDEMGWSEPEQGEESNR